jgi:hypothetical protein
MSHPLTRCCPHCGGALFVHDGEALCPDCVSWTLAEGVVDLKDDGGSPPAPDTEDLPPDTILMFPDDDGPDAAA